MLEGSPSPLCAFCDGVAVWVGGGKQWMCGTAANQREIEIRGFSPLQDTKRAGQGVPG